MDWTAEAIEQLRGLWAEGHSTAEIGRRMGVSKNAVVGKAHRLNLPARPSPIRREPGEGGAAPRPAAQPRRLAVPPPLREPAPLRRPEAPAAAAAPVAAPPPPAAVVRPFPRVAARSCCWPLGEPGTPDFRFCSAEATPGKPYCAEHASVAYVRVRDRREDAA
ncbi:GcrA family cell cycle regulator [Roseicella aerolata]|uniref:GcrA family cell cycle regulator n=1 Tax=Roseicella aerolata TaxID=2883479 RepID=A0A9X1IDH2_9PROT|nr:GcrA family cell cycle regulator [Roseicella aerolata]MCB4822407.1 GcrA family cell cycle regulator [Roseicella aerolata]